MLRPAAATLCLLFLSSALCARAARPLPDLHKWDSYFALFARDSSAPWKVGTVRVDTYSGAPVDLSAYAVDPADVIVAGTNARPRTIDTSKKRAVARWRFTPPQGYRFESSEVALPLGSREGFFVIEARRNNVAQQVWVNRTRIGLLSKQSAGELLLYGADLGTGHALAHMRVSFLVHNRFDVRYTDAHGMVAWRDRSRPIFAMAEYAGSKAFLSFLPQAPVPAAVGGVMVDSAVVKAGDDVRAVGFARLRSGAAFKSAAGDAVVSLRYHGAAVAEQRVRLDASGSFVAVMRVPSGSPAGTYTMLMTAGLASAGTTLQIDASPGGLTLGVVPACQTECSPNDDVPAVVTAHRDGSAAPNTTVHVSIVRSPHVTQGSMAGNDWGTAVVATQDVITGADGSAHFSIAHPTDGLASTYGIRASAGGATAATRLIVPTAKIALQLGLARTQISLGNPLRFDLYGATVADGKPAAGVSVRVRLAHGTSAQEQVLSLDAQGRAHGAFTTPELGTNLILARATYGGADALDAQEAEVVPEVPAENGGTRSLDVRLSFDRAAYRINDRLSVDAFSSGASGDALLTYETPLGIVTALANVHDGHANASFTVRNAPGTLQAGAAFVRDGELRWSSAPVAVIGAGRAQTTPVRLDGDAFSPGGTVRIKIDEGRSADRTIIVRMTAGIPSGSARFDGAPGLLSIGEAASQDTASAQNNWHAGVDATPAHASTLTFDRGISAPPPDITLADAGARSLFWSVSRGASGEIAIPLPQTAGLYTISILEFGDDGSIGASTATVSVR